MCRDTRPTQVARLHLCAGRGDGEGRVRPSAVKWSLAPLYLQTAADVYRQFSPYRLQDTSGLQMSPDASPDVSQAPPRYEKIHCLGSRAGVIIRVRGSPERDILSLRTLGLGLARFGRPSAGAARPNWLILKSEVSEKKFLFVGTT